MRSADDLITVKATITRRLTLDRERLESDPVWSQVSQQLGYVTGDPLTEELVSTYLNHYIVRDQFPHQTPTTNGPGDIDAVQLEVTWPESQ
jgi:hypothetical protein